MTTPRTRFFTILLIWTLPTLSLAGEPLSLREAIERVLIQNPMLREAELDLEAAKTEGITARERPNPELSFTVEDIALEPLHPTPSRSTTMEIGAGGFGLSVDRTREESAIQGFENSKVIVELSHTLELGKKRAKRMAAAGAKVNIKQWDLLQVKAELVRETTTVFFDLLAKQDTVQALQQDVENSLAQVEAVKQRVAEGDAAQIEEIRAIASAESVRAQLAEAQAEQDAGRYRLASLWGEAQPDFQTVVFHTDLTIGLPPLQFYLDNLKLNPRVTRLADDQRFAENQHRLEQANAIPDLTLTVGYAGLPGSAASSTTFGLTSDRRISLSRTQGGDLDRTNTVLFGVSVPIPLWTRNRGRIRSAEIELERVRVRERADPMQLEASLREQYARLQGRYERAKRLEQEALTRWKDVLEKVLDGYKAGKFSVDDLIEARRGYLSAFQDFLTARTDYYELCILLETEAGCLLHHIAKQGPADCPPEHRDYCLVCRS